VLAFAFTVSWARAERCVDPLRPPNLSGLGPIIRSQKLPPTYSVVSDACLGQRGLGPYELLARIILRIPGPLEEGRFIDKPKEFMLVFSDGTLLNPRLESNRQAWYLKHRQDSLESSTAGYRGDPLGVLALATLVLAHQISQRFCELVALSTLPLFGVKMRLGNSPFNLQQTPGHCPKTVLQTSS